MLNVGVSKTNGITQLDLLEHYVREDLNKHAARVMAVLRPLRIVIDNYPDDLVEEMEAVNNPEDPNAGKQKSSIFESALHRAGGFSRRSPEAVLSYDARTRSAAEIRLFHQMYPCCERRFRQRRGTSLYIRS